MFYLSDHGFGHAARNLPIIEVLLEQGYHVIVKMGQAQGAFVKDYLGECERLDVIPGVMDVGLDLKPNSFEIDGEALEVKAGRFVDSWPERISEEVSYLSVNRLRYCSVGIKGREASRD